MSHTPGPWHVFQWDDGSQQGMDDWNVGCPESGEIVAASVWGKDAHLIAAAPELLEALESIANSDADISGGPKFVAIAKAAIAKARGES